VEGAGASVESVAGDIEITGAGGNGTTNLNRGIAVLNGGQIKSTGAGPTAANISLTGTGGTGTDSARGVEVFGATSAVTTVDGDISFVGAGGPSATGSFCPGVLVYGGSQVASTGTGDSAGNISLFGTAGGAGTGASNNSGVRLETAGTKIAAIDGDVLITGNASTTVANAFPGVNFVTGSAIQLTGAGSLSITGTGGISGNSVGSGLRLANSISLANSSVALVGDTMFLDQSTLTINAGAGGHNPAPNRRKAHRPRNHQQPRSHQARLIRRQSRRHHRRHDQYRRRE
jgi:hypothetical protein